MKKQEVQAMFTLAEIPIIAMWELVNQYWPRTPEYHDLIMNSPWWLVKTQWGLIRVGWRKRVIDIDWTDTDLRKVITEDETTKTASMVHAWTVQDAVHYLKILGRELALEQL